MPVYESDELTRGDLEKFRRKNSCKVCGGWLNIFLDNDKDSPNCGKAFIACADWPRSHHDGIEREASEYEKKGVEALNIPTRREIMEQAHGEEKTNKLAKYLGGGAVMTRDAATEIVETLWGTAPAIEKMKCILLCQTYQLNPLMKHLYLIGYKRKVDGKLVVDAKGQQVYDWSIQMGIGATRLLAQRKHNFSYLDFTPRKATTAEVNKILGDQADPGSVYGFVWIKDQASGAEAFGLRGIEKDANIKGTEKGNTHLNMACIRAERLALDRQYPGEMPIDVDVVDERYIDAEYKILDKETGELIETKPKAVAASTEPLPDTDTELVAGATLQNDVHFCKEHQVPYEKKQRGSAIWYAHKTEDGAWCNEKKKEAAPAVEPEPEPPPEPGEETKSFIDSSGMDWLRESLETLRGKKLQAWTESNLLGYIKTTYNVEAATVLEAAGKLDQGQAAHFTKRVKETLDMA